MISISAIIIAKNEEARIARCLASLSWADEIILIDNGSTDGTKKIAKSFGAVIIEDATGDFAYLHNIGKARAYGEWLLYVDADEQVSPELTKEIKEAISFQQSAFSGHEIRRKNYYLGHPWPGDEYILRLMRKDALVAWRGKLHETAQVTGNIGRLNAPLLHDTHRTLAEMVAKTNEWSEVEARLRYEAHHPPIVWWRLLRVTVTAFFDSFVRQGGWKVGTVGWIESIYQALSMFITYAKLWELQEQDQKSKMRSKIKNLWPIMFVVVVWFIFVSPYFLKGLVPFPSRYLVTFFAPWSASYGMPVKNNAMPDVITQIYPWKRLTIDTWKQGQIPWWNPYSFSGTVHAANYQTAVFSPFNLLFWLLPMIDAWSVMVLLQPLLAGIFMYIFLRSLDRSQIASLLGSLSFMFCGFIVVWMAYATLGYAALWLPLLLYAIHEEFKKHSLRHLTLLTVGLGFSFLSGHFQISLYVAGLTFAYLIWETIRTRKWAVAGRALAFFVFGIVVALPQILPTFDAFLQSVRSTSFERGEVIPWQYLITLIAPDFFGNPVTRNDWFGHYAEWAGFIGVIPLMLSILAIVRKKTSVEWFFIFASVLALALTLPTPASDALFTFKVPVLSTSGASRIIVLASFGLGVLASFGIDGLMADWKQRRWKSLAATALIFVLLIGIVWVLTVGDGWLSDEKQVVAMRNFVLPSLLVVVSIVLSFMGFIRVRIIRVGIVGLLLILTIFDMLRFSSKWMPFDPKEYVFPKNKLIEFLSPKQIGYYRVFGNIGNEVATMYSIPSIEGYDAMYQRRYGEFIASAADGKIKPPQRSVVLIDRQGQYIEDVLQLLGVRYVVHRVSDGQNVWAYPFWKYSHYKSVYRDEHFEVFENTEAYLRTILASSYVVATSDQQIIDMLWKKDFPRKTTLILEAEPEIKPEPGEGSSAIAKYSPTEVVVEVKTTVPKLLFLSDVYEKSWKVSVDGNPTPMYRADYAFRAVGVPAGDHVVRFTYEHWHL